MKDKLLIVDDEPDFIKVVKAILEDAGYSVESALNGREAVYAYTASLSTKQPVSLILLDMLMPNLNGVEVAKMIREKETQNNIEPNRAVSIIMFTAFDKPEMDPTKIKEIDSFILKTAGVPELLKLIKEQLKARKRT